MHGAGVFGARRHIFRLLAMRTRQVMLRVAGELGLTALAAEMIGRAVMVESRFPRVQLHGHSADRIFRGIAFRAAMAMAVAAAGGRCGVGGMGVWGVGIAHGRDPNFMLLALHKGSSRWKVKGSRMSPRGAIGHTDTSHRH